MELLDIIQSANQACPETDGFSRAMPTFATDEVEIYCSDAATALRAIAVQRGEFCHGAILSPPYFQKFLYQAGPGEIGLEATITEYLDSLFPVLVLLYEITLPGGAMFLNIGDTWNNYSPIRQHLRDIKYGEGIGLRRSLQDGIREKAALNIPALVADLAQDCGWILRDTIAWVKVGAGRPTHSDRPASAWEPIFYFRKPDRRSGRTYHLYWNGGTLPTNVLMVPPDGDPIHPCPFPTDLVWRLLLAIAPPGAWVIDPFGGTGTVALTAINHGRRAVSIDLSKRFSAIAVERVQAYYQRPNQLDLFANI